MRSFLGSLPRIGALAAFALGVVIGCGEEATVEPAPLATEPADASGGGSAAEGPGGGADGGDGGSVVTGNPTPKSGARTKLVHTDFDGATSYAGFHDATLNTPCTVETWPDGSSRCTPNTSPATNVYFSDAACAQKIVSVSRSGTAPVPGFAAERSTCGAIEGLWKVGALRTSPTFHYKDYTTGVCTATTLSSPGYELHDLAGAVLATDLAQVTTSAPGPARLTQLWYTGADGFMGPARIHDRALDTSCVLEPITDAPTATCAPQSMNPSGYFADNACTVVTAQAGGACAKPALVRHGGCFGAPRFFLPAADEVPRETLFAKSSLGCRATSGVSTATYHLLGTEVTAAVVSRAPAASTARIRAIVHQADGEALHGHTALFDGVKGVECVPWGIATATGIQQYCLPRATHSNQFYSDTSCLTRIDVVPVQRGGATCGPVVNPRLVRKSVTSAENAVHRVSAAPHAAPVYRSDLGKCVLVDRAVTEIFDLGAAVPLTEFAVGTKVIDP